MLVGSDRLCLRQDSEYQRGVTSLLSAVGPTESGRRLLLSLGVAASLAGVPPLLTYARPAAARASRADREGSEIYRTACAGCHGPDGRGMPQDRVGFDIPMPDLSDCNFTREPDHDWAGVIHDGGPARAFDHTMPAFGAALTQEEIDRTIEHVRGFCGDDAWPRGELNFPRALVTEKAFVEDEAVLTTSVSVEGPVSTTSKLIYEQRFGARSQLEVIVPFGFRKRDARTGDTHGGWAEGVGDIGVGVKRDVFHSLDSETVASVAAELFLPTGDEADGYGKGMFVAEPFLALGQGLGALGFIQLQAGAEIPLREDAPGEAFWRVAIGRSFEQGRFGRVWSPMVEIVAARELEEGAVTEWAYVPQLQVTLSRRHHVMIDLGVLMPMNEIDARATQVTGYLLWDWYDGGLAEGW